MDPLLPNSSIIILNGLSSSGKSTLATRLSKMMSDSVIVRCDEVGVDVFNRIIQEKKHTIQNGAPRDLLSLLYRSVPEIDITSLNNDISKEMYNKIKQQASQHTYVINDNAWIQQKDVDDCNEALQGYKMIRVFVHSSFEDLLLRVKKRNQQSNEVEHRVITLPFQDLSAMYRISEKDEQPIDEWQQSAVTHFMEKLQKEFNIVEQTYHQYWRDEAASFFSSLPDFFKQFKLDTQSTSKVSPTFPFDYVVNTSHESLDLCAEKIVKLVTKTN